MGVCARGGGRPGPRSPTCRQNEIGRINRELEIRATRDPATETTQRTQQHRLDQGLAAEQALEAATRISEQQRYQQMHRDTGRDSGRHL